MAEPNTMRAEVKQVLERLRGFQEGGAPRDELLVAVGVISETASAYCDATLAKSMAVVHRALASLPPERAPALKKPLHSSIEGFGGEEHEFRRRSYRAFQLLDHADPRAGGEARSLFESALRAERILVEASLDADAADIGGLIRSLEEFEDLLSATERMQAERRVKLCLLGDGGVGKTSLIRRFVSDSFTEEYRETVGARVTSREIGLAGEEKPGRVSVHLWDIMGHELMGRLRQSYLLGAGGAVLVLSLSDRKSLTGAAGWAKLLGNTVGDVPLTIVANKSDLARPEVKAKEVADLASGLGCEAVEASAKSGSNVVPAFTGLIKRAVGGGGQGDEAAAGSPDAR